VSDLANDLDVGSDIILQLVQDQPHLALLSNDNSEVVSKSERDEIYAKVQEALSQGITSRSKSAAHNNIHSKSLDLLLNNQEDQLVHYNDHLCTKAYDNILSDGAFDILNRIITNITLVSSRHSRAYGTNLSQN